MRTKLSKPGYTPVEVSQGKQLLGLYLRDWLNSYGTTNLRPSTFRGYKVNIENHVIPYIGNTPLRDISAASLDKFYSDLMKKGFAVNTVKYIHRTLSIALEHAQKYHYIEMNPTHDVITKFNIKVKTPDPFTVEQMALLMNSVHGTVWEMIITLAGLYGLRRNEILGLTWNNVNFKNKSFKIVQQLASQSTILDVKMAPVKQESSIRTLPITDVTYDIFKFVQQRQKIDKLRDPEAYHDNNLVVCKENGDTYAATHISRAFNRILSRYDLPHIRFHDLRHTAATNMHELTGDFFTVGEILGHSMKGIGIQLDLGGNLDATTAQYIDIRLERKQYVLNVYHSAVSEAVKQLKEQEINL